MVWAINLSNPGGDVDCLQHTCQGHICRAGYLGALNASSLPKVTRDATMVIVSSGSGTPVGGAGLTRDGRVCAGLG